MAAAAPVDKQVAHWAGELGRAKKRFRTFHDNGDQVVDAYRLQKADGNDANAKDKYNILYSSTETIRPNLYAQQPKPRTKLRSVDTATPVSRVAARLLENCLAYLMQEEAFDELMDNAVEDFLLPGLGVAWVRYEAKVEGEGEAAKLLDEMVKMEYVYWQDFLTGVSRTWKETPWVARRLWLNKDDAARRFGAEKAGQLQYAQREAQNREADNPAETAEAWEIWDKTSRTVYWYAEGVPQLLDEQPDPLKLKNFFPCPKPLRAISNTRTFVPRALYSQYRSQAETLNVLTKRIRLLGEALRVVGMFDGSQPKLADVLNPQAGNRMISVDSWATFAQNGGVLGSVVWLPIDTVVKTLNELLKAREVCKQEIYEITGFSDIVRGVSKASETLGAQNLKANWAGARVKKMQKQVQDFARDIIALAGELIAEHCSPETIAVFSGIQVPPAEQVQSNPALQQQVQVFKEACDMIRDEMRRVAAIDIETDSTLLADDEAERTDRTNFLAAAGAFLQQAVPAMEATPELGPLLGAMLMFVVRTFPSSRPIEEEFEKVQQVLASKSPEEDKDGEKAKAAAEQQKAQLDAQTKQQEMQIKAQAEQSTAQLDATKEQNRHAEKMQELALKEREVQIKERELALKEREVAVKELQARTGQFSAMHSAGMAEENAANAAAQASDKTAVEYDKMDRADAHADADRELSASNADADREARQEAREGASAAAGGADT